MPTVAKPRRTGTQINDLILERARSQHGVVSRLQLLSLGISSTTVVNRLDSGFLVPVFISVYSTGAGILQRNGLWMAASLTGSNGSILSHYSAAALHGLVKARPYIEVIRPGGRTTKRADRRPRGPSVGWDLVVHRSRDLPEEEITVVNGIRTTTAARALLDIAASEQKKHLKSAAVAGENERAWRQHELDRAAARGKGWTGIQNFREVALVFDPEDLLTESELEIQVRQFLRDWDIDLPTVNVPTGVGRVDAIWEKEKLIVEADSWTHHRSREQFENDRRRDNLNLARGYRTLRITDRAMVDRPAETARLIKQARAAGALSTAT